MCVDEIRRVRVKLNPRHHIFPNGVPQNTKYITYVVKLSELAKGKSLGDISPGLSIGVGGGEL